MSNTLLRPKDAAKKAGISISHLYALIAENKFPQLIKISERISALLESEVDEWILEKVETSRK
tara:strand:- start:149 stop:337 length:189 start_codon:yes stop_codon:yes gene_type:complete